MTRKKTLLFLTALLLAYKTFAAVTYIYPRPDSQLNANSNRYTIQLATCRDVNNVKNFIKKNKLENKASYFKKNIEGKNFYILVYGNYHTKTRAHAAMSRLPWPMRKLNPVVKPTYGRNTKTNLSSSQPLQISPIVLQPGIAMPIPHSRTKTSARPMIPSNYKQKTDASTRIALVPTSEYNSSYGNLMATEVPYFDLYPSLNIDLFSGTDTTGKLQSLFPFKGDANQAFFGAVEGGYGFVTDDSDEDGWMAGLGAGYRRVIKNKCILGGYLLGNYNKTPQDNDFYVLNPGIENLWRNWDLRANVYIPIGTREWKVGEKWASDIGKYEDTLRTGHDVYEGRYRTTEQIGTGFDAEIGAAIPGFDSLKLYAGGYYFSTDDLGHISGAEGRLTYKFNDYFTIEARGTYDNYNHGTAIAGLRINLGGIVHKEQNDIGIAGRLLDPIEHNFATFAKGYAIPVKEDDYRLGFFPRGYNYWYFIPKPMSFAATANANQGDGTYENPYKGIDPGKMQNIANYNAANNKIVTDMYFAQGNYSLGTFPSNNLTLPQRYSMWGRVDNFNRPATGNDRATFIGALLLNGGNNTLDSIILKQDPSIKNPMGITIGNNTSRINDININNVQVGVDGQSGYQTGIDINNSDNVNINSSNIYANSAATDAFGININESSLDILNNNTISAFSLSKQSAGISIKGSNRYLTISGNNNINSENSNSSFNSYGVLLSNVNNYQFKITGSNNHIKSTSATGLTGRDSVGVEIGGTNNQFVISGDNNIIETKAIKLSFGALIRGKNNSLTINGSNNIISSRGFINSYGIGVGSVAAVGGSASGTSLNISNARFDINGANDAYGIAAENSQGISLNIFNTVFNIKNDNSSNNAAGIGFIAPANGAISSLLVKNSTFNVTAKTVSKAYGIYNAIGVSNDDRKNLRDNYGNIFGGNIQDANKVNPTPTSSLPLQKIVPKKLKRPDTVTLAEILMKNLNEDKPHHKK